jgi:hypothetical protein
VSRGSRRRGHWLFLLLRAGTQERDRRQRGDKSHKRCFHMELIKLNEGENVDPTGAEQALNRVNPVTFCASSFSPHPSSFQL